VFLLLGDHRIAARRLFYDETYRVEELNDGRTLTPADLKNTDILKGIAVNFVGSISWSPKPCPSDLSSSYSMTSGAGSAERFSTINASAFAQRAGDV